VRDYSERSFAVEDGELVMHAAPQAGRPYSQRCPLAAFQAVALELDDASAGLTREDLRQRTGLPWCQVAVALWFLDERSIIDRKGKRGGRYVPATEAVVEDALTEYHALREGA